MLVVDQRESRGDYNGKRIGSQALTQKDVKQVRTSDLDPSLFLADAPTREGVPEGSLTLQARTPRGIRSRSSVFALIGRQLTSNQVPLTPVKRNGGNRSLSA